MKRIIAIGLMLVMLVLLTACHQEPKGTAWGYIKKDGETVRLTIDFDNKTITASDQMVTVVAYDSYGNVIGNTQTEEEDVYHYTYDDGDITITYPNGATYWESASATGAIGGWDGDYDTDRYINGMTLAMQLTQAYSNSGKDWDGVVLTGILCLVLIAVGIFLIKDPEGAIQMKYGLWFNYVEPTEFHIGAIRVSGIVLIASTVVLFLIALFA